MSVKREGFINEKIYQQKYTAKYFNKFYFYINGRNNI